MILPSHLYRKRHVMVSSLPHCVLLLSTPWVLDTSLFERNWLGRIFSWRSTLLSIQWCEKNFSQLKSHSPQVILTKVTRSIWNHTLYSVNETHHTKWQPWTYYPKQMFSFESTLCFWWINQPPQENLRLS